MSTELTTGSNLNDNSDATIAPAPPGASSGPETTPSSGPESFSSQPRTNGERRTDDVGEAFERAAARRGTKTLPDSSSDGSGQTAKSAEGGETAPADDGASTRDAPSGGDTATTESEPTGGPPAGDSIVTAPEDWPTALKERFDTLSDTEARQIVLDMQRDLQAGFTKATQKLAEVRDRLPTRAQELLAIDEAFSANPREVIAQLARQAGVDVFFERAGPADETPEFESAADMARWARDQALQQFKAEQAAERESQFTAAKEQKARDDFQAELAEAAKLPGFSEARTAVLGRLRDNPALSVTDAFTLVQAEGLRKLAQEGQQAKQELAQLRKEIESMRKRATAPLRGVGGGSAERTTEGLSETEAAMQRAAARLAKERAAAG